MPEARPPHEPALAAFLRYRLDVLGIPVEELIRRSGVSRSTVFRLLGDRPPSIVSTEILHKLAGALGVDAAQLAAVWHGTVSAVEDGSQDERDALVRGFVLAIGDLPYEDLQAALEVAKAAAEMAKRRSPER